MKRSFPIFRPWIQRHGLRLGAALLATAAPLTAQMAIKGNLLLSEDFQRHATYGKERQPSGSGWQIRAAHAQWVRTSEGIKSVWEKGHMPVLVCEGSFGDAVIEVDFRFRAAEGRWSACRVSAANHALNPRAYAVSAWANHNGPGRPAGFVLEYDEWKPGTITTVAAAPELVLAPDRWYTLRMEIIGHRVLVSCNGLVVEGSHEKFGIPKSSLWLGVGTGEHELRNLRVYEGRPAPNWKSAAPAAAANNR